MNKEQKKVHWLNLHCKNKFVITQNETNKKLNIRFNNKKIRQNLSKHLLNKQLDIFEKLLSFGKNLDKIFKEL